MNTNVFSRSDFSNLAFDDKKKILNKIQIQKDDEQDLDGGSSIDSGDSGLSLEDGLSCNICEKIEIISDKLFDVEESVSSIQESLTLDYDCMGQETIMKQTRDIREEIGNCGEKNICEILQDDDCGLCEIKSEIREIKQILDNEGECNLGYIAEGICEINDKLGDCECESVCNILEYNADKLDCIDDKLGECECEESVCSMLSDLQTKIGYLKDAFLALNSAIEDIEFDGEPINFNTNLIINALSSF